MTEPRVPHIPADVVDWLSSVYPDRCPLGTETDREVWQASGQQQVIRKLRALVNAQSENILTESISG